MGITFLSTVIFALLAFSQTRIILEESIEQYISDVLQEMGRVLDVETTAISQIYYFILSNSEIQTALRTANRGHSYRKGKDSIC